MNNILSLKGAFTSKDRSMNGMKISFPNDKSITTEHLSNLIDNLKKIEDYYKDKVLGMEYNKVIFSVYYTRNIAKSNRIHDLFKDEISNNSFDSVVGAKLTKDNKHIITHCITINELDRSIKSLELGSAILQNIYQGSTNCEEMYDRIDGKEFIKRYKRKKSFFSKLMSDAYYVEKFDIEKCNDNEGGNSIISIYDTGIQLKELLNKLDYNIKDISIINNYIYVDKNTLKELKDKAPYLISMGVTDLSNIPILESNNINKDIEMVISKPNNQPTIGVIDTCIDTNVYFNDWITTTNRINKDISIEKEDMEHATTVCSIIVDGPNLNPSLDDNCGNFKVRHFGVALSNGFSSFSIMREIVSIIKENLDIKVWNLSLGSSRAISDEFISPEASILDDLQSKYDIIFVIAGTNNNSDDRMMKLGAPADSINSLVVNSVKSNGEDATYSRRGPVLKFYNKPDVSYYGGDIDNKINVCSTDGRIIEVCGTSYAAPWISRKLAYLIEIMNFDIETAKALIIDSTFNWEDSSYSNTIGYGVVPVKINDIVSSKDSEIKFFIKGTVEQYDNYNYRLPLPVVNDKYPYISKATLCYKTTCSCNQGVDYTDTELDLQYGRINDNRIMTVNNNKQGGDETLNLTEADARKIFRKWDNVKVIREIEKKKLVPKTYYNSYYGIDIKVTNRIASKGKKTNYGLVITFKEMNNVNRKDEFIKLCNINNWLVKEININNCIDLYNIAEEEVIFE